VSKRVLIIDGDSVAYRCAAACETRTISVLHKPTGLTKSFKHRTELKKSFLSKGKEVTDDYIITDVQTPEPLEYCLSTIKNHIKKITEGVNADEVKVFCGEQFNFRLDLPLPTRYKSNRKDNIRPLHLKDAKLFLKNKYKAEEAVGYETDDLCCLTAYEELKQGNIPIFSSVDKDRLSHTGITMVEECETEDEFNGKQFSTWVVPELGELTYEKSTVKGSGIKFLAYQWCCFDKVDGYCAYDLSSVKFGAKSAYDLLKDLPTVKACLEAVIDQFKVFYPEPFTYTDWSGKVHENVTYKDMLELYFACCWMKRTKDDDSTPFALFKQYNVDY